MGHKKNLRSQTRPDLDFFAQVQVKNRVACAFLKPFRALGIMGAVPDIISQESGGKRTLVIIAQFQIAEIIIIMGCCVGLDTNIGKIGTPERL